MTTRIGSGWLFAAALAAPLMLWAADATPAKEKEIDHSVELVVDARHMRVMDKDVSEKDRAEIQETMLGAKVLDAAQFPEIRFHAAAVERASECGWTVRGDLTLHGQTRPVKVEVK